MKKTCAIVIALLMVICMFSCAQKEENVTPTDAPSNATPTAAPTEAPEIPAEPQKIEAMQLFESSKIQGRTTVQKSGIALDWTASSIEFNCYCEGDVTAEIAVKVTPVGGAERMYANVYVDGKLQTETRKDQRLTSNTKKITLAENLEKGKHTIIIERQNEAERGTFYVKSVTLKGVLIEKPQNNNVFIEFIGDSLTTAYGNLYPNGAETESKLTSEPSYDEYQNGSKSYACLTAKLMGADYSIVAQQGLGCEKGYYPHTINSTWKNVCYQNNRKTDWEFERKADIVVIAMGTNDFTFINGGKNTVEATKAAFINLINDVRTVYPNAKIVWTYGMINKSADATVMEVVSEMGGSANNIFAFEMTMDTNGGNGHPSLSAHEKAAENLSNYLKTLL